MPEDSAPKPHFSSYQMSRRQLIGPLARERQEANSFAVRSPSNQHPSFDLISPGGVRAAMRKTHIRSDPTSDQMILHVNHRKYDSTGNNDAVLYRAVWRQPPPPFRKESFPPIFGSPSQKFQKFGGSQPHHLHTTTYGDTPATCPAQLHHALPCCCII